MQIHVDMDGVLADFDSHYLHLFDIRPTRWPDPDSVDWVKVRSVPHFFHTIPLMPDAGELIDGVIASGLPWSILTGVPDSIDVACNQKIDWVRDRIRPVPKVVCCRSRDKFKHGKPGDVLIDDYLKYRDLWVAMGGIFIHHTSAKTSLARLQALL